MNYLIEPFTQPFIQRALVVVIVMAILSGIVGTYVVLRGLAFIGAGISHASFGGIAIALVTGLNIKLMATLFCLITGIGVGVFSESEKIKEDTSIGILFAFTMAIGILLLTFFHGYSGAILSYLFGNILTVTKSDLAFTLLSGTSILLILVLFSEQFKLITFDRQMAVVAGIPVRLFNLVFLVILSVTIVISIQVIGVILISALLVTPAATALLLANNFRGVVILSSSIAVLSGIVGIWLSYVLDIPSGATIVILLTLVFFIVWLIKRRNLS